MPTPEQRREVIKYTGLCVNADCTAHDGIVDRIIALVKYTAERTTSSVLDDLDEEGAGEQGCA